MATQTSLDRVQQLYVAYYGRPADQEGQLYWAERMDAEGEGAIINAFGNSPEYQDRFGELTLAQAVNNLYQQSFGRNADPDGLAYYVGVLERGEKSLAEIATTIINAAGGIDRHVFDGKVAAAAAYTAEFGAAEDYNLEAALAVVAEADGGIFLPSLTAAIENLLAAREALEDFLEEQELDAEEIRNALSDAQGELAGDVASNGSLNILNANLADAQAELSAVNADIAAVAGLRKAIADYQAAQAAEEAASEAFDDAEAQLDGREVTFETRNVLTINIAEDGVVTDGEDNVLIDLDDGNLVITSDGESKVGISALLADIEAFLAAQEALAEAEALTAARLAVVEGIDGGEALLADLVAAQQAVADAEEALESRAELQAAVDDAQALVDQLDTLEEAIEDAEEAIEELGVNLVDGVLPTADNDLFIFAGEDATIEAGFGGEGQDLIFFGSQYSLVQLGEDESIASNVGSSSAFEIFWEEVAGNLVLYVENEAFGGNSSGTSEIATITLTGVSAADISFSGGYLYAEDLGNVA